MKIGTAEELVMHVILKSKLILISCSAVFLCNKYVN